jgi:hypothetical protein
MRSSFFLGLSLLSLAACAAPTSDEQDDSSAEEVVKAGAEGWFQLRPDLRRCVSPMCGGAFVSLVNETKTACIDGSKDESCYAAEVDTSALKLPDDVAAQIRGGGDGVVVKAKLASKKYGNFGSLGVLKVSEAYLAPKTSEPAPENKDAAARYATPEKFYFVHQERIMCFRAPCPQIFEEKTLNAKTVRNVGGLNLDKAAGSDEEKQLVLDASFDGILVFGRNGIGKDNALYGSRVFVKASPALALDGSWGADGAVMSIGSGKGNIEFGCGWASIDTITFSTATKFTATGSHTAGSGVMPPPGHEPQAQPATFSGTLSGTKLTLKMTTGGYTTSMTFTKDRDVNLIRCL